MGNRLSLTLHVVVVSTVNCNSIKTTAVSYHVCVEGGATQVAKVSLLVPDSLGTVRAERFGSGKFIYYSAFLSSQPRRCDLRVRVHYHGHTNIELDSFKKDANFVDVLADEHCWRPDKMKRVDFIQYYDERDSEFRTPHLVLGPHYSFTFVPRHQVLPTSKRPFWFNLIMSLSTSHDRDEFLEYGLKWRKQKKGFNTCGYIHVVANWSKDYWGANKTSHDHNTCPLAGAAHTDTGIGTQHVPSATYRLVLKKSIFTLSPMGHNLECFRIWEAAEAGSIPVIVMNNKNRCHRSLEVLRGTAGSRAPFIFATSLSDAYKQMSSLSQRPKALEERSQQTRDWYGKFMREKVRKIETVLSSKLRKMQPKKPVKKNGSKKGR